jgi:hypothetical protein
MFVDDNALVLPKRCSTLVLRFVDTTLKPCYISTITTEPGELFDG